MLGVLQGIQSSFNSTMVRLKAAYQVCMDAVNAFQFHYGTIKSITSDSKAQIHLIVSIPLWYD